MTLPSDLPLQKLQLYVTTPYTCGYLPNKMAQSLIATPHYFVDSKVYSSLIQQGFRRSGKFAYRPHCKGCQACVPVRVVLQHFKPNRSQKRAFTQHADLTARVMPLGFYQEHFALYQRYQQARHAEPESVTEDNTKDKDEAAQYRQFLCQSQVESGLIEFRDAENRLKIVSVVDIVADGVSAVYTFYDTSTPKASYGIYAIMWQAAWANSLHLPYLYLGYWVAQSQKMIYKQAFKPQQQLIDSEWV
jgi:leucyl-tRNA---protein transferase